MTAVALAKPKTPSEIGMLVAAEIRRFGHYQNHPGTMTALYDNERNPYGLCCVLANKWGWYSETGAPITGEEWLKFSLALLDRIEKDNPNIYGIVDWSNKTSTVLVLRTLESL